MPNPLIGMIGASLGSSAIGAVGASKAAKAQKAAANQEIGFQREVYNDTSKKLEPIRSGGMQAFSALLSEMGLGEKPSGYGGYMESPAARYLLSSGVDSIEGSRAAAGGLYSGATLQALENNRRNVISADTDKYFDRLTGIAGMGQDAASGQSSAGRYFATSAGAAAGRAGQATANGALGVSGALQGGIGDMAGIYGYFSNPMQAYAQPMFGGGR
jgi:type II secretory pathway pseudopilin PulG